MDFFKKISTDKLILITFIGIFIFANLIKLLDNQIDFKEFIGNIFLYSLIVLIPFCIYNLFKK